MLRCARNDEMAESIRIPIDIDFDKGLAQLAKFSNAAKKEIGKIGPGAGTPGGIHIPVKVDTSAAIPSLNNLGNTAKLASTQLGKLPRTSDQATQSLVNLSRVAQDAPYGFLGIANNLNPLLESFQRLKATTGTNVGALKALGASLTGAGGIGLALGVASSLLVVFGDKIFGASKKVEEAEDKLKKYKETVTGIFSEVAKEATQTLSLIAVLKNETETRERKLAAIKELQKIQPEIFGQLKLEGETVNGLDAAYASYINNLKTVIAVKIKQAKLEELITKQLQLQGVAMTASEKQFKGAIDRMNNSLAQIGGVGGDETAWGLRLKNERVAAQKEGDKLANDILTLGKELSELSTVIDISGENKAGKKTDDIFNKIISKAKEVAAYLKENTFFKVGYEFSPLDNKATALAKAQDFLNDVSKGNLKLRTEISVSTFSEPAAQKEFETEVNSVVQGIAKGVIIKPVALDVPFTFSNKFLDNATLIQEFTKQFQVLGNLPKSIQMPTLDMEGPLDKNRIIMIEALQVAKDYKTAIDGINQSIQSLAVDQLSQFGEAVGTALAGGNVKDAFSGFINILASGFTAIGKQMIAASRVIAALKAAIKSLNPAILLPAGIALVGIGAALRATVSKGVTGFAHGGLVFGPTTGLVGEGIGTNRSNPEVISPLNKLKGFFAEMLNDSTRRNANVASGVGFGGGSFTAPAEVRLYASGTDLVGLMALENKKQGRSF